MFPLKPDGAKGIEIDLFLFGAEGALVVWASYRGLDQKAVGFTWWPVYGTFVTQFTCS